MEDKPTFLEETRNADVTRIEYRGAVVRLHWMDVDSGEEGYTDMSQDAFNRSIDKAREEAVLRFDHQPIKQYG